MKLPIARWLGHRAILAGVGSCAVAFPAATVPGHAQVVRGHLVDATAGVGVGGAMVTRRRATGLVGLEFEPTADREVPDISGTVWLDPSAAEVRWLDFRYQNLAVPRALLRASPGGRVEFMSLPNGAWIVTSWHVRMFLPGVATHSLTGLRMVTLERVFDQICDGEEQPSVPQKGLWMHGILMGQVSDDLGQPVERAEVVVLTLAESSDDHMPAEWASVTAATSSSGFYRACWVPVGVPLNIVVLHENEEFDSEDLVGGIKPADLFPGGLQTITIAHEEPYRTLHLVRAPRS